MFHFRVNKVSYTMFDISRLRRLVKTPNSGLHEVDHCQNSPAYPNRDNIHLLSWNIAIHRWKMVKCMLHCSLASSTTLMWESRFVSTPSCIRTYQSNETFITSWNPHNLNLALSFLPVWMGFLWALRKWRKRAVETLSQTHRSSTST